MNLDSGSLLLSILIGCVGMALFVYGKKQSRFPQMLVGVLLCAYPYFVGDVWLMGGIAAALIAGLVVAVRAGM